jgi:hypothetical protein
VGSVLVDLRLQRMTFWLVIWIWSFIPVVVGQAATDLTNPISKRPPSFVIQGVPWYEQVYIPLAPIIRIYGDHHLITDLLLDLQHGQRKIITLEFFPFFFFVRKVS